MIRTFCEEAEEFRGYISKWVHERLVPQAEELEEAGTFPRELTRTSCTK